MDEILRKTHYRSIFLLVVVLLLALCLTLRFYTIPFYDAATRATASVFFVSLLDNLAVSLFLTVFIGGFVFWLTPEIVKRSLIEVVDAKEINKLLKVGAAKTKAWTYKGACGRYTRATTLPKLADAARVDGMGRDITICILNPQNENLCAEYATYRRSLKSGRDVNWTSQYVQEELIATAVAALRFSYSEPLLRIRLYFVNHFSAFRFDICDDYVVVTKEEKEAAALSAQARSYFYDSYKDDVRLTERQGMELKCCGKLVFDGVVDDAKLREAISCASFFDATKLDELNVERILQCINQPADPY